jgi:hypothetical protein
MAMSRGSTIKGDWAVDFATICGNVELDGGDASYWDQAQGSDNVYVIPISKASATVGPLANYKTVMASAANISSAEPAFAALKSYKNNHALDPDYGFYYYSGKRWQEGPMELPTGAFTGTVSKRRNDTETRIVGEYYPIGNGDGLNAIGFSDTHVSMMKTNVTSGNAHSIAPDVLNATGEPFGGEAVE